MFHPKFEITKDGHELTWQSNYLGHFLLTHLLLPKLEAAESARIGSSTSDFLLTNPSFFSICFIAHA